jgi:hypothetical protein
MTDLFVSRLFARAPHPYYIWAPQYQQASGGVRALHYLCHALNLIGQEAYILTRPTNPELITPLITPEVQRSHQEAGRNPIVVYPEVVSDNPAGALNVARWLLAIPGLHTGVPIDLGPHDLVFHIGRNLVPEGWEADPLILPLVDTRIFNSVGVDDSQRSGSAVFVHRHLDLGGEFLPLTADSIEISFRVPYRGPSELAAIFRSVEVLYLYEQSTIVFEALLCGCPVVYLENETSLPERFEWLFDGNGISWGAEEASLARAKQTVHLAVEYYKRQDAEFWDELDNFVRKTQQQAI